LSSIDRKLKVGQQTVRQLNSHFGVLMEIKDLENRFSFHPAVDEETKQAHEMVRNACLRLAIDFNNVLPDGREKSLVVTTLEEVMFWANAAIARKPRPRLTVVE
jgi:hypothetical protein